MKYEIEYSETTSCRETVEADNMQQAYQMFYKLLENNQIDMMIDVEGINIERV